MDRGDGGSGPKSSPSVIAANTVGIDGLAAVGLMTPFFSVTNFFCAVINSGTVKNYSYEHGQFHKRKAGEYFGLGVLMSLISGVFITAFLPFMHLTNLTRQHIRLWSIL